MAIREYFDNGTDHTHLAGWQTKPELPTVREVMGTDQLGDDFALTVNNISGPGPSTDLYLETHYNLLREDAVAPLRDAIATFRQRPGMTDNNNLVIYERVFFTHLIMAHRGMAFRACSTRRAGRRILWRYSSRLLAGKIVALSPANDMFSSKCVVAVVAARPLEGVTKTPPEVDLFFAQPEDMDFDPLKEWVMVESRSGYYEAHRHTMTALQKLSRERFPLSNHICGLEKQSDVPEYISSNPVMEFRAFAPSVSQRKWPVNVVERRRCQWQTSNRFWDSCHLQTRYHDNSIKDWHTNGNCQEMCGAILDCEHQCPLKCHRTPHSEVKCTRLCLHTQPCCSIQCSGYQCWERHVHSRGCVSTPTLRESLEQTRLLTPLAPFASRSSAEGPESSTLISFSDEETPIDLPLAEKARTKEVKNNAANDPAPIPRWTPPRFHSLFTSSQKSSIQKQGERESEAELIQFAQAYGGARASENDWARSVLPKKENTLSTRKTHLLDAFEEEMEASKVVALKPEVKRIPESHETVPVQHLLD